MVPSSNGYDTSLSSWKYGFNSRRHHQSIQMEPVAQGLSAALESRVMLVRVQPVPPNENSIPTGMLFFCSEILFRSDKLVYRLSAFISCTTNWCLQVCFGSAQKTVGEAFMPHGGKTSRLFAPSGENAACTRPAEYLPYSKNVACSEIYKHQFIRLTKTDSLNWCLLGSFKHFKKAVTEERSGAESKDLRTKLTKKRNEMRRSLGSALT